MPHLLFLLRLGFQVSRGVHQSSKIGAFDHFTNHSKAFIGVIDGTELQHIRRHLTDNNLTFSTEVQ